MKKAGNKKQNTQLAFLGEYVQLMLTTQTQTEKQTEEGVVINTVPLCITGLMLDFDDDFYYLGTKEYGISHAIKKTEVLIIEISNDSKTVYEELFDRLPDNPEPEEIN